MSRQEVRVIHFVGDKEASLLRSLRNRIEFSKTLEESMKKLKGEVEKLAMRFFVEGKEKTIRLVPGEKGKKAIEFTRCSKFAVNQDRARKIFISFPGVLTAENKGTALVPEWQDNIYKGLLAMFGNLSIVESVMSLVKDQTKTEISYKVNEEEFRKAGEIEGIEETTFSKIGVREI